MENNYTIRDVLNDCLLIDEALARIARHEEETGVSVIGFQPDCRGTGRVGLQLFTGIAKLASEVGVVVASETRASDEYPHGAKFRYIDTEFYQVGDTPEEAIR